MKQMNLFEKFPEQIMPGKLSPLLTKKEEQQKNYDDLQSFLPRWVRKHGWELYLEVVGYRAWHSKMLITTDICDTPNDASDIAIHAAIFYGTGDIPTTAKVPSNIKFPNSYRFINGKHVWAKMEYEQIWKPFHQSQERYFSR